MVFAETIDGDWKSISLINPIAVSSEVRDLTGVHVLIAEDQKMNAEILTDFLEAE